MKHSLQPRLRRGGIRSESVMGDIRISDIMIPKPEANPGICTTQVISNCDTFPSFDRRDLRMNLSKSIYECSSPTFVCIVLSLACTAVAIVSYWHSFIEFQARVLSLDRADRAAQDFRPSALGAKATERCIISLTDCDLSCLDWTIVLAMGRSGSTTVQQMISKLPGMHFYGEEGGLLKKMRELQKTIDHAYVALPWWGSSDKNVTTLACMTQKFYAERHGDFCQERGCRHGWKEIRYNRPELINWIRITFPTSKIILNYRSSCSNYVDNWHRDCETLKKQTNNFLRITQNLTNVFHMKLEGLNDLGKWKQLANFLGYSCEALNVTSANLNRSISHRPLEYNPWKCSQA